LRYLKKPAGHITTIIPFTESDCKKKAGTRVRS